MMSCKLSMRTLLFLEHSSLLRVVKPLLEPMEYRRVRSRSKEYQVAQKNHTHVCGRVHGDHRVILYDPRVIPFPKSGIGIGPSAVFLGRKRAGKDR